MSRLQTAVTGAVPVPSTTLCEITGCGAPCRSRGLCRNHDMTRWRASNRERLAQSRRKHLSKREAVHRAAMNTIKLAAGCADCGYADDPTNLHFHHLDKSTKSFALSRG